MSTEDFGGSDFGDFEDGEPWRLDYRWLNDTVMSAEPWGNRCSIGVSYTGCLRSRWTRLTMASINRVHSGLERKGLNPSKPRWIGGEDPWMVEADTSGHGRYRSATLKT